MTGSATRRAREGAAHRPPLLNSGRLAVIYIFRCPKGRVYVGRHTARLGHDPRQWPRRGTGALPDGYRGSGDAWLNVVRQRGLDAMEWRVLHVVPARRAAMDRAERRAVALTLGIFGERCVNIREGGQGLTSRESRRLWADPKRRAGMLAGLAATGQLQAQRVQADPQYKARITALLTGDNQRKAPLSGRSKALAAAVRRRDSGELPLARDNELLRVVGERLNRRRPLEPREPREGTNQRTILDLLRCRPCGLTCDDAARLLGWPTKRARNAMDWLRATGWPLVCEPHPARGNVIRLAVPDSAPPPPRAMIDVGFAAACPGWR